MNDNLEATQLAHELLISFLLLRDAAAQQDPRYLFEQTQLSWAKSMPMTVTTRNLSLETGELALKHINAMMEATLQALSD